MTVRNLTSLDSYDLMKSLSDAVLIDVRTPLEWQRTGIVNQKNQSYTILLISIYNDTHMQNEKFTEEISNKITNFDTSLFFLCKSGVRSSVAANLITGFGYLNCYSISDGFEGSNAGPGWKSNNLPWRFLNY